MLRPQAHFVRCPPRGAQCPSGGRAGTDMAGSARYTAILDACVLYPATLRDLLLSLARDGLFHARWTGRIQNEWVRSLLKCRPELEETALRRTCALMAMAVPDSVVHGWQSIEPGLTGLPDVDDRHVLAATICGHADAIVTFNPRRLSGRGAGAVRRGGAAPGRLLVEPARSEPDRRAQVHQGDAWHWRNPQLTAARRGRRARKAAIAAGGSATARSGRADLSR